MKHIKHIVVLLIFMLLFQPVSAQTSPPAPTTCPYQQACQIIGQAMQLLQKYNIQPTELDSLLKAFGTGGQEGMAGRLMELGLDQTQTGALLQEAAPLLQGGMNNSYIQTYIGELVNGKVKENDLTASRQQEIVKELRNPDEILAILTELGIEGEEAELFLEMALFVSELGYSPATFDRTAQANAIYALLSETGLGDEELSRLTMLALSDIDTFEAEAGSLGIDLTYLYENFEGAYINFFLENGFNEDEIGAFQELVFASEVIEAGDNVEDLANLLLQYGYDEADIASLLDGFDGWEDPFALIEFFGQLGMDWSDDYNDLLTLSDDPEFNESLDVWLDENSDNNNSDDQNSDDQNSDDNNSDE
ncbi:MAG: hypothetical protein SFZ02_02950 [bacterium]|nr:hypothetical protein [bacterium]